MRLVDIEADCYRRLGFGATQTGTDVQTRIRAFINETHREILRRKHFRRFRRQLTTVSSVANSPFMALPQAAVRVFGIQDRTNDYLLEEKELLWVRSMDPALRATAAAPWAYAIYNLASPVVAQPAGASSIFVKSSDAADTTQTANIEGIDSSGNYRSASVTLNGTTAVQLVPTAISFTNITKLFLSAAAAGSVTLTEDSGSGGTLAVLSPGRLFARYTVFHLYPVPSAVSSYYADIEVHVEDMSSPNDEPLIPEEFHGILGLGARKKEYEHREKWVAVTAMDNEFKNEVSRMVTWVNQKSGLQAGEASRRRYSQLGSWFPSGT